MGFVVAELTLLGLEKIGFELIEDVPTFRQNAPRKAKAKATYDTTGEQVVEEYTKDNPSFSVSDLTEHFKTLGRPTQSAYGAVGVLVKAGFLRKLGKGMYQRADVVALAAPPKKPKGKRGQGQRYEVGNVDFLFAFVGRKTTIRVADVVQHFRENGRIDKSATAVMSTLTAKGYLKKLGQGEYEVLKKPPPQKQRMNGVSHDGAASHG
jgi:predicted transcriptional regulator of viral defense system